MVGSGFPRIPSAKCEKSSAPKRSLLAGASRTPSMTGPKTSQVDVGFSAAAKVFVSLDCFFVKILTGNHGFYHQIWGVPVL